MGDVYRSVPRIEDERVGHVDEEGNVFRHQPHAPDKRLGHFTPDGEVYRHRALRSDERVGYVDKEGNVFRDVRRGRDRRAGRLGRSLVRWRAWSSMLTFGRVGDEFCIQPGEFGY